MSAPRYRPKRRLRSELFPLAVVLSLPLSLYFAFPSGVVGFAPPPPAARRAVTYAFVSLDADREMKLLAAARSSWQSDSSSRRGVRADLLACDFSEQYSHIASGLRPSAAERLPSVTDYELDVVPRGVGADGPAVLPAERSVAAPAAFPDDELLKLK